MLFDLDGTLVDTAPGIARALGVLLRSRGGSEPEPKAIRPLISLGPREVVRRALGPLLEDLEADLRELRGILREVRGDPADVYPGVAAALDALDRPLAVVTNKPEELANALLRDVGLLGRFERVVGGDTVGRSKPHPDPILHALRALGCGNVALVGDSAVDAGAARAAGVPFLLFEGGYGAAAVADELVTARFAYWADLPGMAARTCRSAR